MKPGGGNRSPLASWKNFASEVTGIASVGSVCRPASASVGSRLARQQAVAAFSAFDQQMLADIDGPIMLKHPLSALFIDELTEVFDCQIVTVVRDFDDVERTRKRRKWSQYFGSKGAKIIYLALVNAIAKTDAPVLWLKYRDLLEDTDKQVMTIAHFIGLDGDPTAIARAIATVRRSQ